MSLSLVNFYINDVSDLIVPFSDWIASESSSSVPIRLDSIFLLQIEFRLRRFINRQIERAQSDQMHTSSGKHIYEYITSLFGY